MNVNCYLSELLMLTNKNILILVRQRNYIVNSNLASIYVLLWTQNKWTAHNQNVLQVRIKNTNITMIHIDKLDLLFSD